jgi:4'-phosphopantetheinyl transferase
MDVYWLEQTAADMPPSDDWLGARETARLETLRFPKRRADWRLGRWTVKLAVAHLQGLDTAEPALADIQIDAARSGAPQIFLGGQRSGLAVSLSHRSGRALCALATGPVELGCDLEVVEPRSDVFLQDYFTPEEQALVAEAPADLESQLVTLLWSAKESALKALRTGLRLDTRTLTVVTGYGEQSGGWRPLAVRYRCSQTFQGWWRRAGDQVRTVVATPPPQCPVRLPEPLHAQPDSALTARERW